MTLCDVELALSLCCTLLIFYLAGVAVGVSIFKALSGSYGHTSVRFIPTGAISPGNLKAYLKLPIVSAIGGSWMMDRN